MKNLTVICLLFAIGGCASAGVADRVAALEARIDRIEQGVGTDRDARSQAANALTAAQQAKRSAQQALDAARAAAEKADRISSECCTPK